MLRHLLVPAVLGSLAVSSYAQNSTPKPVPAKARSATSTLNPGDESGNDSLRTERILVEDTAVPPYVIEGAFGATKTDTPLLEIPQTVNVVSRQVLDDQFTLTIPEALRNVGGVNTGGTYRDYDIYSIRGFFGTGFTYLDGLLVDRQSVFQEEPFDLERVEVIQGPASVLYGQNPPGGLVNLISKKPQKTNFTQTIVGGGSFDLVETGVDTNAVLNKSGSVYGRVNVLWRQFGNFTEKVDPSERLLIAPSLTLELTRNTRLTLLGQYYHDWREIAYPLPAAGTVLPNINGDLSIFRNVGEPDAYPNTADNWRTQLGYQLEHHFNDILTFRQNVRASLNESKFRGVYPSFLDADQRTLNRFVYTNLQRYTTLGADTSLLANFNTGPNIQHTALVGVDFYYLHEVTKGGFGSIGPIDIFKPVFGSKPFGIAPFSSQVTDANQTGIYFQEQVKFFDRLSIVGGGRGDFVDNDVNQRLTSTESQGNESAFSPRIGVVYEILPKQVSAYFSYSESFLSQPGFLGAGGGQVEPERGTQYEIGAKAELFGGRLSSTVALYQIYRTNVPTADAANPAVYVVTGEQRHRGVDFNTTLGLVKGWDLIAAYGYVDARVTEDNTLPVGVRPLDVPEHTFNIFTKYTLQTGPLQGVGASIGYRYQTKMAGDSANTFYLPSFGVLDLGAYYERGRFRAQVNVTNVTDERYYSGAFNQVYVQPGDPIGVRSSVGWRF